MEKKFLERFRGELIKTNKKNLQLKKQSREKVTNYM